MWQIGVHVSPALHSVRHADPVTLKVQALRMIPPAKASLFPRLGETPVHISILDSKARNKRPGFSTSLHRLKQLDNNPERLAYAFPAYLVTLGIDYAVSLPGLLQLLWRHGDMATSSMKSALAVYRINVNGELLSSLAETSPTSQGLENQGHEASSGISNVQQA